jgi:Mn2+/Fe2+ NRAMP family transporter
MQADSAVVLGFVAVAGVALLVLALSTQKYERRHRVAIGLLVLACVASLAVVFHFSGTASAMPDKASARPAP